MDPNFRKLAKQTGELEPNTKEPYEILFDRACDPKHQAETNEAAEQLQDFAENGLSIKKDKKK